MLNNIGGNSVAEAKERLTHHEVLGWIAYREKYGTLDRNRRLERHFAMLTHLTSRVAGGKAELKDYMIYSQQAVAVISLEQAVEAWT
ncbi:phage tail assembly protein T [Pseudomonas sp. TWR3-1-1]|uniref:phage tail assembly protein T n=1 Tax=Pseudomonas sp. TWR3-1-1 TaxID=2804633 RepID=UPI003CF17965